MGADAIVSLVSGLLGLVAQVAPGLLAGLTGQSDDTAAIDVARRALARIPVSPAAHAIDAVRAQRIAASLRSPIWEHADHVAEEMEKAVMPARTRESIEALVAHARGDERRGNGG